MENKIKSLIKKLGKLGFSVSKNPSHKDPVCGMRVSNDLLQVEYKNQTYYFCSEHCKEQFETKPTNYVD